MRLPDASQGMGILQAVLDRESARGNHASVDVEARLVRGDPPVAVLRRPVDRAALEAELDLGPLLAWWPRQAGRWDLVDTVSGAEVRSGEPSPAGWLARRSRHPRPPDERTRLGWLADDPRLDRSSGTERREWRASTSRPAEDVLADIADIADVVAWSDGRRPSMPEWFIDRLQPERSDAGWAAYFEHRRTLSVQQLRLVGWSTRWTERYWRHAMQPDELTWSWVGAERAGTRSFDLAVDVLRGAPISSLKWLLHVAGVEQCGPPGRDLPPRT